jgi:hypothetical protein
MSSGSTRITIRIGDAMLGIMDAEIEKHNSHPACQEEWNRTDFIMQAIAEKLSHFGRGRKDGSQVSQFHTDKNMPREVFEE